MTRSELEKIIDGLIIRAKNLFLKVGYISPMVFFCYPEGRITPIPMRMRNDREKEKMAFIIKKIVDQTQAEAVIIIHESWLSIVKPKGRSKEDILEEFNRLPPSQRSDRLEVITIHGKCIGGEVGKIIKIIRNDKKINLEEMPLEDEPFNFNWESRFTKNCFLFH